MDWGVSRPDLPEKEAPPPDFYEARTALSSTAPVKPVRSRMRVLTMLALIAGVIGVVFLNYAWSGRDVDASGWVYRGADSGHRGVVLLQGRRSNFDGPVVGALRKGLSGSGLHTVSLKLPAIEGPWQQYVKSFPAVFQQIRAAIVMLRKSHDVSHITIIGFSMGARMSSAFADIAKTGEIDALVVVGCRNNGGGQLDCENNLNGVDVPVLDVWGGGSAKDVEAGEGRASMAGSRYRQHVFAGAKHALLGQEDELVKIVAEWIKEQP